MAISQVVDGFVYARNAGADLSAKLHFFAKIASDGDIELAGDGGVVAGVIIEAATQNNPATIQFGGIGKVVAAETIDEGDRIASDADGKAVVAAVGDFEVGTAISPAAAGENVSFIFASGRRHA